MTDQEILKEFRDEYKKAYKGILSDEVLEKGNPWFEVFILKVAQKAREEGRKEGRESQRMSNEIANSKLH